MSFVNETIRPDASASSERTTTGDSFAIATKGKAACVVPEGGANAGYFVSTTSYIHSDITDVCDPGRYLDAMIFPGIAVPKSLTSRGVKFGDFVLVRNRKNGKTAFGVVYDGSGGRIGESSIAMNRLLLCRMRRSSAMRRLPACGYLPSPFSPLPASIRS